MINIYTVVPCRTYKVSATEACTLTDGHRLTLQLEPGTPATFEAHTSEIHSTAPVALEVAEPKGDAKYVTVQVRGVKKVEHTWNGGINKTTKFLTSASGWRILDPLGVVANWQTDCAVNCSPGWLFRELWERPSASDETEVAMVGWEFVLRAGEEEFLVRNALDFANALYQATGGFNTLHVKKIYHD